MASLEDQTRLLDDLQREINHVVSVVFPSDAPYRTTDQTSKSASPDYLKRPARTTGQSPQRKPPS